MKTDTSENGLEKLIMRHMTGVDGLAPGATMDVAEVTAYGGNATLLPFKRHSLNDRSGRSPD